MTLQKIKLNNLAENSLNIREIKATCTTILIIISSIIMLGCTSQTKTNNTTEDNSDIIPTIDLAHAIEYQGRALKLSDFVEDIEYVRPEYPTTLVDFIFDISLNDNYLLLEVKDRLLCYTRNGKFIREIGRRGQGPKEHLGIRSHGLYKDLVAINSNFNRKILWYNTNGDYLHETPVSENVFRINILDTNRVVIHPHHGVSIDTSDLFVTGIIDKNGDTLKLIKDEPYYSKGRMPSPSIWNYNDTVRVLTCINDTVYSVTKNEILPAYILNFGKYKVTREAFEDVRLLQDERNKFIQSLSFCETSRYVLAMFQYDNKRWVAMYDKLATEIFAWNIKPKNVNKYGFLEGGGWINDIDGGVAPTYFNSINNDYFAINVQPEELKNQFTENKRSVDIKYGDKQIKLESLINSLNEDENPIIIIYKLKK